MNATGLLTLEISGTTHLVSGMSSLLRTLQAAVRDSAQRSESGARLLARQPPPSLTVDISTVAPGRLVLWFSFTGPDGEANDALNTAAFDAFISDLSDMLRVSPQSSLWGTPVRPLIRAAGENERLQLFLEDVLRLGDVTIGASGRRIRLDEGRVEPAEAG